MAEIHNKQLQCEVESIEYDFQTRSGIVRMPWMNCTDMMGCIRLFEAIDPEVRSIQTLEAGHPDTQYIRMPSGKWQAQRPPNDVEHAKLRAFGFMAG
jgi:hypothetical protein